MSHRDFIAMQAMMKYEPVAHYDSGEDGIFPECRSCRFHRPYAQNHTCVFRTCPYAAKTISTRKPTRWILVYVNPIRNNGGDYPERQHHRPIQSEGRHGENNNLRQPGHRACAGGETCAGGGQRPTGKLKKLLF